jgi:flagellar protein FliS
MTSQDARLRYLADRVSTATPAALIVMLYDRLGVDIELAAAAQDAGDPAAASGPLRHAQQILAELLTSLDTAAWSGGDDLAALYRYLLMGLIAAKSTPDPSALRGFGTIVTELRSAWHGAALELAAAGSASVLQDNQPAVAGAWVG